MEQKQKSQAGRIILTLLLCMVLFVTSICALVVADLHQLTQKNTLQTLLTQVLIGSAPHHTHIGGLSAGAVAFDWPQEGSNAGMLNDLLDEYYDRLAVEYEIPIDKEQVKQILSQTTIPTFVTDKTAGILSDLLSGTQTVTITTEEVEALLEENREVIEQVLGMPIPEEVVSGITAWVDDNGSSLVTDLQSSVMESIGISSDDLPDSTGSSGSSGDIGGTGSNSTANFAAMAMQAIYFVSSARSILAAFGICAMLSLLILLVNLKKISAGLRSNGITYLLAGIMGMVPYLASSFLMGFVPAKFSGIITAVVEVMLKPAAIMAGVGAMLLIAGIIFGAIGKKPSCPTPLSPEQ